MSLFPVANGLFVNDDTQFDPLLCVDATLGKLLLHTRLDLISRPSTSPKSSHGSDPCISFTRSPAVSESASDNMICTCVIPSP